MKNKQILLHTGLPKAGSTFLQRRLFPEFPGWNIYTSDHDLPKELGFLYCLNAGHDEVEKRGHITRCNVSPIACENPLRWANSVASLIHKDEKNVLFSSEGLCGVSYSPLRNNLEIAVLLQHFFGAAKVFFMFRKQADYCESLYRQLVFAEDRFRRYLTFDQMYTMQPSQKSLAGISELNWTRIIENYHSVFGKENVLALPYEMMFIDLPGLVARIEEFSGVQTKLPPEFFHERERVSPTRSEYKGQSMLHRLLIPVFEGLNKPKKDEINYSHRENNRALSSLIGLDLVHFGYFD